MQRVAAILRGRRAAPVAVPVPVPMPSPRLTQRHVLAPPLTPPPAEEMIRSQDPDQTPVLENDDENEPNERLEAEEQAEEEAPDWIDALARHDRYRDSDDLEDLMDYRYLDDLDDEERVGRSESSSSSSSSSSGNSSDDDHDAHDAPFLMAALPVLPVLGNDHQHNQQQQLQRHVQFQVNDNDIGLDFGADLPEIEVPNARQVPDEIDLTGDSDDEAPVEAVPRPLAPPSDGQVIVIADDGHDDIVIAPGVPPASSRRKRRRNESDAVSTETAANKRARMFDTDRAESTSVTLENSETIERFKNALKCSVCLDNIHEMTSTICGHVYCRECITLAVRVNHKCPLCQRSLRLNNIHPLYF